MVSSSQIANNNNNNNSDGISIKRFFQSFLSGRSFSAVRDYLQEASWVDWGDVIDFAVQVGGTAAVSLLVMIWITSQRKKKKKIKTKGVNEEDEEDSSGHDLFAKFPLVRQTTMPESKVRASVPLHVYDGRAFTILGWSQQYELVADLLPDGWYPMHTTGRATAGEKMALLAIRITDAARSSIGPHRLFEYCVVATRDASALSLDMYNDFSLLQNAVDCPSARMFVQAMWTDEPLAQEYYSNVCGFSEVRLGKVELIDRVHPSHSFSFSVVDRLSTRMVASGALHDGQSLPMSLLRWLRFPSFIRAFGARSLFRLHTQYYFGPTMLAMASTDAPLLEYRAGGRALNAHAFCVSNGEQLLFGTFDQCLYQRIKFEPRIVHHHSHTKLVRFSM